MSLFSSEVEEDEEDDSFSGIMSSFWKHKAKEESEETNEGE